jgi:hypothetical protein
MATEPPRETQTGMWKDGVSTEHESVSVDQLQRLYGLISGYRVSQALYVVAKLDIAGLLADGPRTSDDLAEATGTHAGALYRVLRFLAGVGLFDEVAPRRFSLTSLGVGLRGDVPGTIRPMVLMLLDGYHWQPWGELLHTVQTGETAFHYVHGMGVFEYLQEHSETAADFNRAMTSNTAQSGTAITQAYDFSGVQRLVDIGGGHGLLLATVLGAHPTMQGVLFDHPDVVAGASVVLEETGVADRCEIVSGDFFRSVPSDCDAYVLRQIIHDWDDARAVQILRNCRDSMGGQGKILVVERRVDPDYHHALQVLHVDLEMLVNVGGCQRTDEEYRALFAAAGLRMTNIIPLNDAAQFSVFEGVPA